MDLQRHTSATGLNDSSTDKQIAATALLNGLTVATRNGKDFEALGVNVLNPFED